MDQLQMLNSHSNEEDRESESYNKHFNRRWNDKDFDSISNFSESTIANSEYVEARIKYHEKQQHQQHRKMQHHNHIDDEYTYQIIKIKVDALHIDGDKNEDDKIVRNIEEILEKSTPQTVPQSKSPFIKCCQQIKLFYFIFVIIIIVMSIAIIMTHITVNEISTDSFENKYINLINKYTTENPSYHFNNKQTTNETQSTIEQLVVQKSEILRLKNETHTGIDYFRNIFFKKIGETIGCDPNKPNLTKHFYISRNVTLDWISALLYCSSLNMKLATLINKEEEVEFLDLINTSNFHHQFESQIPHLHIYIGGTIEGSEGVWYWESSGENISYDINWNDGEPNNIYDKQPTPENCLALMNINNGYKFNDLFCERKAAFVCEFVRE